jgi:nucleotide-binding universal stress UspA family protein
MSNRTRNEASPRPKGRRPGTHRLLFVADAAVADVDELPPAARAIIEAAAAAYVLTPTLPGRLAWLADDVDRYRHLADDRLDTVLAHMRSIDAHASGAALRGSVLTVIADAVARFQPDHILVALRSPDDANWQERRLIEHIEQRFGLPVMSYAVDHRGHASTADGPLLLCSDGAEDARHAIERASALFPGRHALVVSVWQPTVLGSLGYAGETAASMGSFVELDQTAAELASRVATDGARLAREAGLDAEPLSVEATGAVWTTIVKTADRHDAAAIVMGARGHTGIHSMLLGSVSSAVVHHADRPTLVIPSPVDSGRRPAALA